MADNNLLNQEKIIEAKSKLGKQAAIIIAKDLKREDWRNDRKTYRYYWS